MVSQPEAPGLPPIPGTREEIARVAAIVEKEPDIKAVRLEDGAATKAAVLSAMGDHSWIHLACHGCQDPKEPLKSGFALADGRLEASTIIKHNSKHAEFAFLSACQTSTGDVTLSEESVHLAAAMLVAGYRGVVGTLWSINDRHAPDVAEDFYRELLDRSGKVEGKERLDGEQAAYALHYAVQRLRKRVGDSNYLVWAPYVHLGV
jgi:CHAT domain-containing protein